MNCKRRISSGREQFNLLKPNGVTYRLLQHLEIGHSVHALRSSIINSGKKSTLSYQVLTDLSF